MSVNVMFWGCQIPARFPFIEKSLRKVFDALDFRIRDVNGFTCCPEKALVGNMSKDVWTLTAARNLAVAREGAGENLTLIQACNGCFSTLKTVQENLDHDPALLSKVNDGLNSVNLSYRGGVEVKHIVEMFHDVIGADVIKSQIKRSLNGLKIAVHPGCHMTRPSSAIDFDDPIVPKKFDSLIRALGGTNIDYHAKMLCCGGELTNIGDIEKGTDVTRQKLIETRSLEVDAMAVACPNCFKQLDNQQFMMQRDGEDFSIPIFYISELIGLTLGIEPKDLGIESHRVKTERFFERWNEVDESTGKSAQHFDLDALKACYECGACLDDCPSARILEDYDPKAVMEKVIAGKLDDAVNDHRIWQCLECHTCTELCPQGFGMEKVFTTLKKMAGEQGIRPASVEKGLEMFTKTSRIGEPSMAQRKKLNLPNPPESGFTQWKEMIDSIKKTKDEKQEGVL
ncbi:MAG: 4Fe-4S dicluster domain-containing protein [Candidatus Schekmanbacteria bacterium]|nr:4Fe-4S dicluster domain-containing protein [Candidatus Schekmanbacteria bacterium]